MIFYSTYDILDEVYYKNTMPGIIVDVTFTLDDETGYMMETYGIQFEDGTYIMFVSPSEISYQQPNKPQTQLS